MPKWKRIGLIFRPERQRPWIVSHAALPVADHLNGDRFRVYFSARDEQGRARIGYFELDLTTPFDLLALSDLPVLGLGPLGTFDDNGVTSAWVVTRGARKFLYYSGWTTGGTVPFRFFIGLAASEDAGRSFGRISAGPILDRSDVDPYLTGSPCVLVERGQWRMWYVSGTAWEEGGGRPRHRYHIKYAESQDGVRWQRSGTVCVDYASPDEYAIARPTVIWHEGRYRMWFCCRGAAYRLGYAESPDGFRWERDDAQAGLDVSVEGWDSEMLAYPFVFYHRGALYLLYNGDGYGRTGIGLAVLE
jgi:hypothetical protein